VPASTQSVMVTIAPVAGPVRGGLGLWVCLVDATSADEPSMEISCRSIDDWDGSGCVVHLPTSDLSPSRDYIITAHAGATREITVGDWLNTDWTPVDGMSAHVRLRLV
jgi:hypothetical protein